VAAGLVVIPEVVDSQLAGLLQFVLTAPVQSYLVAWADTLAPQKTKKPSIKTFSKKNLINYLPIFSFNKVKNSANSSARIVVRLY
jgi:hypothetical protein